MITRLGLLFAAVVCLALAGLPVFARTSVAAGPLPEFGAADAALVGVALDEPGSSESFGISPAEAIVTAASIVPAVRTSPVLTVSARASATSADAARTVWVVVASGGRVPSWGPVRPDGSAPVPPTARLTGVIVDRETGEVLRWFVLSDLAPRP